MDPTPPSEGIKKQMVKDQIILIPGGTKTSSTKTVAADGTPVVEAKDVDAGSARTNHRSSFGRKCPLLLATLRLSPTVKPCVGDSGEPVLGSWSWLIGGDHISLWTTQSFAINVGLNDNPLGF
jgi:hypothetical protein